MSYAEQELSDEDQTYIEKYGLEAFRASKNAYRHSFVAAIILSFIMAYSTHTSVIRAIAAAIVFGWIIFGLILMLTSWIFPD